MKKMGDIILGSIPDKNIEISKESPYKFKYTSSIYNIRSIYLYVKDQEMKSKVSVNIYKGNEKNLVSTGKSEDVNNEWIEVKFHPVFGIYNEELIFEISCDEDTCNLYLDKHDDLCLKIQYEEMDKAVAKELDKYVKELRTIYNSAGWKFLVRLYNVRDKILNFFRGIKKFFKIIYVIIKNINVANMRRAKEFIKDEGFKAFVRKAYGKLRGERLDYTYWLQNHLATKAELEAQRSYKFEYEPKISILIPTYKTPKHLLIETLDSVINQTYSNWELCIVDGHSETPHVNEILDEYSSKYDKIKVKYLDENKGIDGNTQEAYYMATGDYIGLFDHDDLLEPNALYEIVKAINEDNTIDFIYTDEDKINEKSNYRFDPHFKQDFAPDTFRSYNYICHFSVFRKDLMDKIGGFRYGFNGSQDYDIILRATENANNIRHIPKVLYSWRVHSGSTAGNPKNKMYCYDSAKKAIDEQLKRLGLKGKAVDGKYIGTYEVEYDIIGNPKVSILIPTKDHIEDLNRTITSIFDKTSYKNYEIIVIENNSELEETFEYYKEIEKKYSNVKVVTWEKGFNYSAINNFGAKFATGDHILLLNNDVEVINEGWLTKMVSLSQREDVGCVGAKLYYPDDTIQHGGVIVGLGGTAAHAHRGLNKNDYGFFLRLGITQNLSAVTGACLLIKKSVFDEVNGLDETFEVAYNDVDFCLRVLMTGRVNVWTPYAELYHYESKSRGLEDTEEKQKRFMGEFNRFRERYADFLEKGDPYYSCNLTLSKEDFSYRF
ncbi:glycosyltransferase family 2 protein [uncultured Clostridium sp.]|uniref:glycosyltransferase family 2 protein n=1 Tax=uncultured Clostridium sp. TaxID=59620 RepID=UPI0025EB50A8|nr:glycosyltransferase family 2 protein [uncultured Clostridium sp.]